MTPAEQTTCLAALGIVARTMQRLGIEDDHGAGARCPYLSQMKETTHR
jgi:hypothetical protein